MKRASAIAAAVVILQGGVMLRASRVVAQSGPSQTAASLVKPQAFISLDAVPQGKPFEAAVVVAIQQGYHMNSHTPS